jgi:predicted aspartyl protease
MPTFIRLFCLFFLLVLANCSEVPAIDCSFREVAKSPMEVQDRLLVVPVAMNGKTVRLVVDTGAERTTISDAAAERIGLQRDTRFTTRSFGVGGLTVAQDVKLDRFVLGETRMPIERVAVGTFRLKNERGLDADGLLGADILLAFDLDIDVPGQQLALYRRRLCPNARPPWQGEAIEIPGVEVRRDRLLVPFVLDGFPGTALLDTGAQGTVVGPALAQRMGLTERAMAADIVVRQRGVGPGVAISHMHRFQLLRVGPTSTPAPLLTVLPTDAGIGDMLIGEDFLTGRRVWLSFKPAQVFVSRRDQPQEVAERRPPPALPMFK